MSRFMTLRTGSFPPLGSRPAAVVWIGRLDPIGFAVIYRRDVVRLPLEDLMAKQLDWYYHRKG